MVVVTSTMLELGMQAQDFSLPSTKGNVVSLKDFKSGNALLVVFMCNHCPFVKHILKTLISLAREYQSKGVDVVGINSNDIDEYPEDRPEVMAKVARDMGFTFPYLYDETQQTAKAYHASCTPDFFLFDSHKRLVYRGQMDDSRPGSNIPVTGTDLRNALDALLQGRAVQQNQKPSMGCSIKWKQGKEPEYVTSSK